MCAADQHRPIHPAWLLSTLPATRPYDPSEGGFAPSGLVVGRMSRLDQNRFTASGLDAGYLFYVELDFWVVPYE